MGANQSIALYLPSSTTGYSANIVGLAEALNDNSTSSWNGANYSTYGGLTRGGKVGSAISSAPYDVAGSIEYDTLETQYQAASYGASPQWQPNLISTTAKGYSFIKTKFQSQQRFNDVTDAHIGFNGLKFNNATIIWSRYCPGSEISASSLPEAVTFLTETTGGAVTAYPTIISETLWMLNARPDFINMYISDDPEFAYGFTGFKPGQDNLSMVGQLLLNWALTVRGPRYHKQLKGITG
jgi:hypothetical protein